MARHPRLRLPVQSRIQYIRHLLQLSLLLASLDPFFFDDAPRARHKKRLIRHVFYHGAARGDIGILSDVHRGNQVAVAADKGIILHTRAVFGFAIVVDKHNTAAEIDVLS